MIKIFLEDAPAGSGTTLAGHLYLVLRDMNDLSPAKVIRGGSPGGGGILVLEVDIRLSDSADRYVVENNDTPLTRHARDITTDVTTAFGGDAASAWARMSDYARGIDNIGYKYELPGTPGIQNHIANSNAVVLSVLNSVGTDVGAILDRDAQSYYPLGFPGAEPTFVYGGLPTLLGSNLVSQPQRIIASEGMREGFAILGRDSIADYMIGTKFADAFYGEQVASPDAEADSVSYERSVSDADSPGAVTVFLNDDGTGLGRGGHAQADIYYGIANIIGSPEGDTLKERASGENRLAGGDGGDRLTSTAGDDELDGGAGDDLLVSESSGATTFVFGRGYGRDVVVNQVGASGGVRDTSGDEVFLVNLGPADIEVWHDGLVSPFGPMGSDPFRRGCR